MCNMRQFSKHDFFCTIQFDLDSFMCNTFAVLHLLFLHLCLPNVLSRTITCHKIVCIKDAKLRQEFQFYNLLIIMQHEVWRNVAFAYLHASNAEH